MPGLASLASALSSKLPTKVSNAYLIELDKKTDAPVKGTSPAPFQYFPETISDSKAINYQQKEVPGGSLPLYQWVSSGERLISFTAIFTCDVDYAVSPPNINADATSVALDASATKLQERLKSSGQVRRNPDVRGAIAWLRRHMFPTYSGTVAEHNTQAPNKLRLYLPNSGIGVLGGGDSASSFSDSIYCVMTQCEVTYDSYFPSGLIRVATVALAFAQIPQFKGAVFFPNANPGSSIQKLSDAYTKLATFTKG